jgi:hypothetical protein
MKIKVENMTSGSGNSIANQFIITTDEGRYFQSYSSIIAFRPFSGGKIQLDKNYWDYSKTTGKYRNMFLRDNNKAKTQKRINNGIYELVDLNNEEL